MKALYTHTSSSVPLNKAAVIILLRVAFEQEKFSGRYVSYYSLFQCLLNC